VQQTFETTDGVVYVEELGKETRRIAIRRDKRTHRPYTCVWETSYPLGLIQRILEVKGAAWLCDEIRRDEDDSYVKKYLSFATFAYVAQKDFTNKRILDFGCGAGASTMVLAGLFPQSRVIGIDFVTESLEIARLRVQHYETKNVEFLASPAPNSFPANLGTFDYVFLSAVYEHLLPNERQDLLPEVWRHLADGGVLFINETPHRYFPIESHTTGLPLINYLPDSVALHLARYFSKRIRRQEDWETLLRMGIRGGTVGEIMRVLRTSREAPVLLEPCVAGVADHSDIWFQVALERASHPLKKIAVSAAYFVKKATYANFGPYLSLAIRKQAHTSTKEW
jgi:ubiquinone/menaquinone biosynthesis C-methylase UbiE